MFDMDADEQFKQEVIRAIAYPAVDLATNDTVQILRECNNCGVKEGDSVELKRCAKCSDTNQLQQAWYCSKTCQVAHWEKHKAWHKSEKKRHAREQRSAAEHGIAVGGFAVSDKRILETRKNGTKYEQLLATATELMAQHEYKSAVKKLLKAIKIDPDGVDGRSLLAQGKFQPLVPKTKILMV